MRNESMIVDQLLSNQSSDLRFDWNYFALGNYVNHLVFISNNYF